MLRMGKAKRLLSCFLTLVMLTGLLPATVMADTVSVNIVSFLRGAQTDLRAGELLEAKVTGYNGNVQDLTYEWSIDNELNTYLYVYNSHNMYGIKDTDGEQEIYNDNLSPSANMAGRTHEDKFSGKGFAWAALYDANTNASDLVGKVTVIVKDADGNELARDSHEGTVEQTGSGWWAEYEYSGFVQADLNADMQHVAIGMFAGETREVRSLLGESSIVHIDCTASSASGIILEQYTPVSVEMQGNNNLRAYDAGDNTQGGDAVVRVTVSKSNCKFHQYESGSAEVFVYVYKKPETSSTTTTITLAKDSLDERCTYYILGNQGVKQADGSILFTGLTPNTRYEIEVVGKTSDTDPVYAYVYEDTLPVYHATVDVVLHRHGQTEAEAVDLDKMLGKNESEVKLALKLKNGDDMFLMEKTATGVYKTTTGLENGEYIPQFSVDGGSTWIADTQELVINNADRKRTMNFYAVEYYVDGTLWKEEYFHRGEAAHVISETPTKDQFDFAGWDDADSAAVYQKDDHLTSDVEKAYKLNATWEEADVQPQM